LIETFIRWFEYAEMHAAALLGLSLLTLIATLIAMPILILRLPSGYFLEDDRPRPLSRHLAVHWFLMALKNLLGLTLFLIGLFLVFLPGQGLLTMIIGLTIMNYPGKFHIERWLVLRPGVLKAMNWLRHRFGVAPLETP
jgi:hypothetical protein